MGESKEHGLRWFSLLNTYTTFEEDEKDNGVVFHWLRVYDTGRWIRTCFLRLNDEKFREDDPKYKNLY